MEKWNSLLPPTPRLQARLYMRLEGWHVTTSPRCFLFKMADELCTFTIKGKSYRQLMNAKTSKRHSASVSLRHQVSEDLFCATMTLYLFISIMNFNQLSYMKFYKNITTNTLSYFRGYYEK